METSRYIWTPCKGLSKPFVSVDTRRNAEAKSQTFFYILIQVWWNKKYKLQYFRVKTIPIPILLHMTMRLMIWFILYCQTIWGNLCLNIYISIKYLLTIFYFCFEQSTRMTIIWARDAKNQFLDSKLLFVCMVGGG